MATDELPALPESVDVVVIGGGIIGVSTAYFLAKKGVSVLLCEKGVIAGEQSSRNWGFVRQQGRAPEELPLIMESLRIWRGIEKEIGDLGKRARDGSLSMDDLTGGTFTVTNGGVYGSLMSTPILNPPQSGILGMHKIQPRPIAVDDAVEIRPMMYLALSYDHRIIDGSEAVTFLVRVKECIEEPDRILLGI